ncbi:HAD-IIIA family hydrolase [Acidisphaera sp. L21]|uniref:D-glycero-alpha-D-manno-heptose-1,7-bisphosphate 7-phosphatase n=1 Tax=Acidisphaera sp. L21 TaxID=1641851 RepID=UPI001C20BA99|nr:HAD family hydrolase [Acidisphaera sp. L21]
MPASGAVAAMRELARFGVTEFVLLGDETSPPALPISVRTTYRPKMPAAQDVLEDRFLLCEPGTMLNFNLARFLAAAVPGRSCVASGTGLSLRVQAGSQPPLSIAVASLPTQSPRPALFLDRDGTINIDHGYIGTRERFEWVDGALEAIRMATDAGWHVFVVTNQSGIARGMYDEPALVTLHRWMVDEIRATGGNIDDIRVCPFHEQASVPQYRRASDWRKPAPGMILDLIARWSLDPATCVLVGDQPTDIAAADSAGIASVLFTSGNLVDTVAPLLGRA